MWHTKFVFFVLHSCFLHLLIPTYSLVMRKCCTNVEIVFFYLNLYISLQCSLYLPWVVYVFKGFHGTTKSVLPKSRAYAQLMLNWLIILFTRCSTRVVLQLIQPLIWVCVQTHPAPSALFTLCAVFFEAVLSWRRLSLNKTWFSLLVKYWLAYVMSFKIPGEAEWRWGRGLRCTTQATMLRHVTKGEGVSLRGRAMLEEMGLLRHSGSLLSYHGDKKASKQRSSSTVIDDGLILRVAFFLS